MSSDTSPTEGELVTRLVYSRVLARGAERLAQVWFRSRVLDKYRGSSAYSIIRTNTAGRLSRARQWSLDFGIADAADAQATLIHASLGDLTQKLPEEERDHWAQHVVTPPVSANFLKMQMSPGSCFDDGEVRAW